jgi:hypothetical protein
MNSCGKEFVNNRHKSLEKYCHKCPSNEIDSNGENTTNMKEKPQQFAGVLRAQDWIRTSTSLRTLRPEHATGAGVPDS